MLGFNLKIWKAKQPATGSYLYLRPKMGNPDSMNPQIETESETCLSCFRFLSSSGIKGEHHYLPKGPKFPGKKT